jgi:adenine specific DNA methylase Mod
MLFMADSYVYENVFDEKCQKVVRLLRQNGGYQKHSLLLKRTRESLDMFKRIIETLQSNGTLESYIESGKGRPAVYYRLLE